MWDSAAAMFHQKEEEDAVEDWTFTLLPTSTVLIQKFPNAIPYGMQCYKQLKHVMVQNNIFLKCFKISYLLPLWVRISVGGIQLT